MLQLRLMLLAWLSMTQLFSSAWATPVFQEQEESAFLQIINDFRTNLGIQTVAHDARLEEAARKHADWMSRYRVLTHLGPRPWGKSYTRMYSAGIPTGTLVGENIARGSFTAKNTFIQWFFSSAHLEGMMTPEYDHIGIAREGCEDEAQENGLCYWVTDFAQLNEAGESVTEAAFSKQQIVDAAEKVIGALDVEKKAQFLNPTPSKQTNVIESDDE